MIRRTLTILIVTIITNLIASAQLTVGEWKLYTPFDGAERIVATPDRYYYLSNGSLFSYDPEKLESYSYTTQNKLNDTQIDNIYYNRENKYLAVAYENGNIDLLYDNGKVVNMSDIRDATLSASKKINYITFAGNRMYVATDFGIVIFDDTRHYVIESGIYNTPVLVFTRLGDYYLIGYNEGFHYLPASQRISTLDKFKQIFYSQNIAIQPIGQNELIGCFQVADWDNKIIRYQFDFENDKVTFETVIDKFIADNIDPWDNGYYISGKDNLLTFDDSGKTQSITPCPYYPPAFWKSNSDIMAAYKTGMAPLTFEDGQWQATGDAIVPGTISTKSVDLLKFDNWGNLYLSGIDYSRYYSYDSNARTPVNRISADGNIEDLEPVNMTFPINVMVPADKKLWDTSSLTPHPAKPGTFYLSNMFQGLRIHENNEITATYNENNSPIKKWWGCTAMEITFDNHNNMWAILNYDSDPSLYFLPSDKIDNPVENDWQPISLNGFKTEHDAKILYAKKSGVIAITTSRYESPIVFYDTKGTSTLSDDTFSQVDRFIDQDGREFFNFRHPSLFEDESGKIWIGSSNGVIIVNNPRAIAANPSTPVTRVKVPRNDGTNLADYLLAGEMILSIDADNSNRKWIATKENGAYLVSADGTEIIEHFTTDNSPLPSNSIHAVACDKNSSSIFFGTPLGLAEYSSSSSPSRPDYSEVIAYPNPVRPDYTGWITIKGLMENSLVKIADAAGNVIFTTRSEGGMAMWDGCNLSGNRVKTGIYYVFASHGDDSSSKSEAVTKIMIVN